MSIGKIQAEILAPAGNYECFLAAINSGADAVYLGGNMFGARAFAGNFSDEELVNAINYAHLFGKKVYLTVNTLLRNEETDKLIDYIRPFYEAGLDACIVQDLGVFSVLKRNFPDMDLHASTQMTICGVHGAKLLKDLGASRIVTARELTAKEIKDIHDNVEIEIESFVHGALCYSYSGQCLLSSMIGGRSGNRGRCAQPCRLNYECNSKSGYLLSPKDMCTIEVIPDILDAGVYSLKIEGRMKSPEYVAGVTAAYRKYVDMYLEKGRKGFKVDSEDLFMLMDLYNRGGFCEGYYYKQNDVNMMTFDRPNHRGVLVGKIKNNKVVLSRNVNASDVLELSDGNEFTVPVGQTAGKTIEIPYIKGAKAVNDSLVYRTRNNELLKNIRTKYIEKGIKIPVYMYASFEVGQKPVLTLGVKDESDFEAVYVNVEGENVIEPSRNNSASYSDVLTKLEKLGNTSFECKREDINIVLSDNCFIPVKVINELRRKACEKLEGSLSRAHRQVTKETCKIECNIASRLDCDKTEFSVQIINENQLNTILSEFADRFKRIYVCTEVAGIDGAISMCRTVHNMDRALECFLVMPYIFRKRAVDLWNNKLSDIKNAEFDGVVIRNIEQFDYLKITGLTNQFEGKIIADYCMYAYNKEAFHMLDKLGVNGYTLSEEMNKRQLENLCNSVDGKHRFIEKIVYAHLPLMVSAGCTKSYTSPKSPCGESGVYKIKDRTGKHMPAINSCTYCYNLILNNTPEYLADKVEELGKMGVNALRYVFTFENDVRIRDVLNKNVSEYTRGHYNRGVD